MTRVLLAGLAAALLTTSALAQTSPSINAPTAAQRPVVPVPSAQTTAPSGTTTTTSTSATTSTAPLDANQYSTELAAKGHCPADTVVWVNTKSRKYHLSDSRAYGKTKRGAYMCQKDADAAGDHQAGSGATKKKDTTKG